MASIERYLIGVRNLGLLSAIKYKISKRLYKSRELASLSSKHLRNPVLYRPGTSDLSVFRQIFVEREYSCFDDLSDVGLIIDLGANVGYSSAYFLSRFQKCFVVAVEPDKDNFAVLTRNLAQYQGRCIAVHAAAWPEKTMLCLVSESMGLGNEWGRRVTANTQEGQWVQALDVDSLMAMTDYDRISVLKIDIEGAERELFARNFASWLNRPDNFCIEVHDTVCREVLEKAIAGRGFALSSSGELLVGRGPTVLR